MTKRTTKPSQGEYFPSPAAEGFVDFSIGVLRSQAPAKWEEISLWENLGVLPQTECWRRPLNFLEGVLCLKFEKPVRETVISLLKHELAGATSIAEATKNTYLKMPAQLRNRKQQEIGPVRAHASVSIQGAFGKKRLKTVAIQDDEVLRRIDEALGGPHRSVKPSVAARIVYQAVERCTELGTAVPAFLLPFVKSAMDVADVPRSAKLDPRKFAKADEILTKDPNISAEKLAAALGVTRPTAAKIIKILGRPLPASE